MTTLLWDDVSCNEASEPLENRPQAGWLSKGNEILRIYCTWQASSIGYDLTTQNGQRTSLPAYLPASTYVGAVFIAENFGRCMCCWCNLKWHFCELMFTSKSGKFKILCLNRVRLFSHVIHTCLRHVRFQITRCDVKSDNVFDIMSWFRGR